MHPRLSAVSVAPAGERAPGEVAREAVAASLRARPLRGWSAMVGLVFFVLALWALHAALERYDYREIVAALRALPGGRITLALVLAAAGYAVLPGYDLLAFRFIGRPAPLSEIAVASCVSGAFGNNIGNTLVTGAGVRYWLYTAFGFSAGEVARVVVFCSLGFWLGYLFLGAILFLADPVGIPEGLHVPFGTTRPLGIALLVALGAYVAMVAVRKRPLGSGDWKLPLPSLPLSLAQLAVASLDLALMGACLWVLLPAGGELSFPQFLAMFMLALVAGNASQVPGGLGVFEGVMLTLLVPHVAAPDAAAGLVAFRLVYFILPLLLASVVVGIRQAQVIGTWVGRLGRWATMAVPRLLAAAAFVAGALLLASGAVPAASGRLDWLNEYLPLSIIETSHFLASVVGILLLLVARGLQMRLDAAYVVALVMLVFGALFSLAKGFDYEEAIVLLAMAAALAPCRRHFYRKASLFAETFTWGWIVSIVIVVVGTAGLGAFAHKRTEYAGDLWWRFALQAEAPRSLRATVGAMGLLVLVASARLLRPARPHPRPPNAKDIERARPIVARSRSTYANLVLRGDKSVIFSPSGDAFLMYGCARRSWIAMGDPVGPREQAAELGWQFRGLCDRYGGRPVFFEVGHENLDLYLDLGLTLTKLGEEARVDLARFSIDTPGAAELRQARSRVARRGCRFEIVPREQVPAVLPDLRRISEAWLAGKATREKGFSNASYDPGYLQQFPVAVVRRGDEAIAFANLWLGADKEELSVDLMRFVPDSPNGTMDFLFTELLLWGRAAGYRWFNFGMAPLSGLEARAGAPLWHRLGTLVFEQGEHFYNFRGLRHYKEKFGPVWTPRYLASPGGIALPAVLVDVTSLVAGGIMGIITK
jgi:phosphatidylglycerol lysyltransferase